MKEENLQTLLIPNHSQEAEQALLGALLFDFHSLHLIDIPLKREDFYSYANRLIYQNICKLVDEGKPADVLTVFDSLSSEGKITEVGGLEYLNRLTEANSSAANINEYAKIIVDKSLKRKVVTTLNSLLGELAQPNETSAQDMLDKVQSDILSLEGNDGETLGGFEPTDVLVDRLYDSLETAKTNAFVNLGLAGVGTGIASLDDETKGFRPGQLIILAARPSVGKTALALQIAKNVGLFHKKPVAIFSMEMTSEDLIKRLTCSQSRIDFKTIDTGLLTKEDWTKFHKATEELKNAPIYVEKTTNLNLYNIKSKCRKLASKVGQLGLIVIDYLQLISCGNESFANGASRTYELGEISRGLKLLAIELKVPILLLSQLNRQVDSRPSHIPVLSDLRDSGAIEQDADIVIMLRRLGLYNPSDDQELTDIYLVKHRNGKTGDFTVNFKGHFQTFEEKNAWEK